MSNLIALAISGAYIMLVLVLATLVAKYTDGAAENSRKLVHILVGNWVFITPYFTSLWAVILVPAVFVVVNSLSLKYKLIPAMERDDDSLGTVYYAISMLLLAGGAFVLGWPLLSFAGLLTMAYGDGLAAIVGARWNRIRPFAQAPGKTLSGTLTVGAAGFLFTVVAIALFERSAFSTAGGVGRVLLIALLTAVIGAYAELGGKRGCDNLTLPLATGLTASLLFYYGSPGLLVYMTIALGLLVAAYSVRAITHDGILAALLTALTLYTLGNLWVAAALLVFFALGSAVSKIKNDTKRTAESGQESSGARTWRQVLANSLPACLIMWVNQFNPGHPFLGLLAITLFAAAQADTFSSELGMLSKSKVFNILNGKPVPSGLSGGVSWAGFGAGLLGSMLLSLLAIPDYGLVGFVFSASIGFAGSVLDSVLGAALQRKYVTETGLLQDRQDSLRSAPAAGLKVISNNAVNLMTLSILTLAAMVLYYIQY